MIHLDDGIQSDMHNVKRFRGGLVFKAHRLLYHSTLGSRVIKKKKKSTTCDETSGKELRAKVLLCSTSYI